MMKKLITGIITSLIFGLLIWQFFHGGIPRHHILDRKDLPEISNSWGGLLLPLLTWFLLGRIERRYSQRGTKHQQDSNRYIKIIGLFFVGLILGILLAVSFTNDYKAFLDNVLYVILILSLLLPIYYAECILGVILGMTYTFGAILPTAFMLIMAALGFLLYKITRLLIARIRKILGKHSP